MILPPLVGWHSSFNPITPTGVSIVMGAHLEYAKYSKIHHNTCILMYFVYSNGFPSQYCHHYIIPPSIIFQITLLCAHEIYHTVI